MTSDEQRQAEMRRGAEMAARHDALVAPARLREERMEVLRRLIEAGKLRLKMSGKNQVAYLADQHRRRVLTVDVDPITAEVIGPAFPSEQFVAMCILAVEAHGEWVDIPDESEARRAASEQRRRLDEQRKLLSETGWKSVYEK